MASNKDLISKINSVAAEKGVSTPPTDGLKNDQLAELLKELNALEAKTPEQLEAEPMAKVAEGVSLTTKAGIKTEGDLVGAGDLGGGSVAFEDLLKRGLIKE